MLGKLKLTAITSILNLIMLRDWALQRLADYEYESIDEMKHANCLARRILFLNENIIAGRLPVFNQFETMDKEETLQLKEYAGCNAPYPDPSS